MKQTSTIRRPVAIAAAIAACAVLSPAVTAAQDAPPEPEAPAAEREDERARAALREEQQRLREEERRLREEQRRLRDEERLIRREEGQSRRSEEDMRRAEERLRAAEARLAEAAREVAEINRTIAPRAMRMVEQLEIDSDRPRLGVSLGREVIRAPGEDRIEEVRILSVSPGSPAEEAGVLGGDRLMSIDGRPLEAAGLDGALDVIGTVLDGKEKGDTVALGIRREGEPLELTLTLGDNAFRPNVFAFGFGGDAFAPEVAELQRRVEVLGDDEGRYAYSMFFGGLQSPLVDMELVELTPDLGEYFGAERGLLVVRAPSAEAVGLQDGDVIRSIGGREPDNVRHAMRILRSYEAGETMELEIIRKKRRRTLSVEVPEPDSSESLFVPGGWVPAPPAPESTPSAVTPVTPVTPPTPRLAPAARRSTV